MSTVGAWRVSRLAQEGRTQAWKSPLSKETELGMYGGHGGQSSQGRVPGRRKLLGESTLESCRRSSSSHQLNAGQCIHVRRPPEAREREGIVFEAHTGLAIVQQINQQED